jgi:hypothetical protein
MAEEQDTTEQAPAKPHYRPKTFAEPHTVVWMIRVENIPMLFSSKEVAKATIESSYPDHVVSESQDLDHTVVFDVIHDGRIQDRIVVMEVTVHGIATSLPGRRAIPSEF